MERLNNSGSLDINDNRTEEEKQLIELRKRIKQLAMENEREGVVNYTVN